MNRFMVLLPDKTTEMAIADSVSVWPSGVAEFRRLIQDNQVVKFYYGVGQWTRITPVD
jgi:hypothetical protein